jgi:hypothetical protein
MVLTMAWKRFAIICLSKEKYGLFSAHPAQIKFYRYRASKDAGIYRMFNPPTRRSLHSGGTEHLISLNFGSCPRVNSFENVTGG